VDENFIRKITYNIGNLLSLMYMLTAETFDRRYRYSRNFAIYYHWCSAPIYIYIYIGDSVLRQWV